jgi:fermentation-respiration switch protein FrsA (DUF1100 family)
MWLKIFLITVVILFTTVLVVKRFAYFRPCYNFTAPLENYQDVYEGNLHAWYRKGTSGKVILFCHGNAGNLSHRQDKLIELLKMGHSILIFDYSGFGQSKGIPNEQLCYANADLFVNYLNRKGYKMSDIIPYGESLGAAVASYISRKYNLQMVIIESGLPGIKYLIKSWHPLLFFLGGIFSEFDTVSYLDGYKGKILVLHCINDEIVPYKITDKMRDFATKHIQMEGTHNNPVIPWKEVEEFITQI